MQERAIQISSVNRQKTGRNRSEDFVAKFDPVLQLERGIYHELAMDRVNDVFMAQH